MASIDIFTNVYDYLEIADAARLARTNKYMLNYHVDHQAYFDAMLENVYHGNCSVPVAVLSAKIGIDKMDRELLYVNANNCDNYDMLDYVLRHDATVINPADIESAIVSDGIKLACILITYASREILEYIGSMYLVKNNARIVRHMVTIGYVDYIDFSYAKLAPGLFKYVLRRTSRPLEYFVPIAVQSVENLRALHAAGHNDISSAMIQREDVALEAHKLGMKFDVDDIIICALQYEHINILKMYMRSIKPEHLPWIKISNIAKFVLHHRRDFTPQELLDNAFNVELMRHAVIKLGYIPPGNYPRLIDDFSA